MNAKTILMALAATAATAAIADVVEVKFTVKTEVVGTNGKTNLANKVISGVYDTDSKTNTFWTTETQKVNGKNVKTNVVYQGTYFGLVNDKTVAKKIGQNAELIWGDAEDPENVLVAGAWGSAASKSGQAAGILNGVPATGTWSAKVNTRKTYDQLLKDNKVAQAKNESEGVIARAESDIKDALATIADIEDAINGLNDKALPNMLEEYLEDTYEKAVAMTNDATKTINKIEDAYKAYAESVDEDAAAAAIYVATTNYQAKAQAWTNANDLAGALNYTNDMVNVADLGTWYTNAYDNVTNKIAVATNLIAKAQKGFASYTNELTTTIIDLTNKIDQVVETAVVAEMGLAQAVATNAAAYAEAETNLKDAKAKADSFNPNALVAGEDYDTYDDFVKKGSYDDTVAAQTAYNRYVANEQDKAGQNVTNALGFAQNDYNTASNNYATASDALTYAKENLADAKDKLDQAIASGEVPEASALKEEVKDLEKELDDLADELKFWKAYTISADGKEKLAEDYAKAAEAVTNAGRAKDVAEQALEDLENAEPQPSKKLSDLAKLIGLNDEDLAAIAKKDGLAGVREAVDEYLDTPLGGTKDGLSLNGMVEAGKNLISAVEHLVKVLGLDADDEKAL